MTVINTEIGAFIVSQTEDTSVQPTVDFLLVYDVSASGIKKAKPSNLGVTYTPPAQQRAIELKIFDDATVIASGIGKLIFCIPELYDGYEIIQVDSFVTTVSSSGAVSVQILNITDSVNVLSTETSIDQSELTSFTAATPSVIDNPTVATGDLLGINVSSQGTGAKGLGVIMTIQEVV